MKHAYLILAHNEFDILRMLIARLDDPRNDIYVHIDKKVPVMPDLHATKAGLTVLSERIDVRWGAPSMIQAELQLFETALKEGPYQYYHLLSGVDLPLKNQDYIHAYFDKFDGDEFIGYTWTEMPPEFRRKMQCWHLFPEQFKSKNLFIKAMRAGFLRLQEALGLYRNQAIDFKKGSQWVSITEGLVRYIIEHKAWIRKTFRNTFCCDELVVQTLCWMSPFRKSIHSLTSDSDGCLRMIGWRERPGCKEWVLEDWTASDFEALKASSALFARKFNSRDEAFLQQVLTLSEP